MRVGRPASSGFRNALAFAAVILALTSSSAFAQLGPPPAQLTPLTETDAVHAGAVAHLAVEVTLPAGLHTNSNTPRDPMLIPINVAIEPQNGAKADEVVYPTPVDLQQAGSPQPLSVFTGDFVIGVALAIDSSVKPGDLPVKGTVHYQACDEKLCYAPKTLPIAWTLHVVPAATKLTPQHAELFQKIPWGRGTKSGAAAAQGSVPGAQASVPAARGSSPEAALDGFTVLGTTNGYLGSSDFLAFIHDAETGVTRKGMFEGRGPLAILLIVFLGGLALNLTPCVLPMVPINLAIIGAGAKAGSRKRGFLLGAAYGAAMAAVYGILGLVVILTAGTFGGINSTWWFNVGIAALFVVLSLAMFDVITIDFSGLSSGVKVGDSQRGTFLVAFGMGAIAALLAGACVAPVVVQVVLFSSDLYAKGAAAALALPFVLGIGMAVPWPIAGAGIDAMPRPGAWMVRVKQAFGVIILATAVYYGYESYQILSNRWVNPADVTASVQEQLKEGWHPLDEGLAAAAREGKPVLIDMWATWCKNCLTMDQTTLKNQDVNRALSGYVKVKFEAEDLDAPETKAVLQRFKSPGLPTYAILRPTPTR